jgi:CobQ-like glutamine amidotransferase family enzyme
MLSMHLYEVRPRKDHRGVNLISDALPFGRLWYGEPNAVSNAVDYAKFRSRSHDAVIRVYDDAGNVIETHKHAGRVQRVVSVTRVKQKAARLCSMAADCEVSRLYR